MTLREEAFAAIECRKWRPIFDPEHDRDCARDREELRNQNKDLNEFVAEAEAEGWREIEYVAPGEWKALCPHHARQT